MDNFRLLHAWLTKHLESKAAKNKTIFTYSNDQSMKRTCNIDHLPTELNNKLEISLVLFLNEKSQYHLEEYGS